jgi:protein-disulfide isomerase/uncharacterized membrane protein
MRSTLPSTRNLLLALLLLLCVTGLLIAFNLQATNEFTVCRSSGCEAVLASRFSHVGRWSIATIGAGFYTTMILLWGTIVGVGSIKPRRIFLMTGLTLSILALGISIFLVVLQVFVIHAVCPLCLTSAILCAAITATTFFLSRHSDWSAQPLAAVSSAAILIIFGFHFPTQHSPIVARIGRQTITQEQMQSEIGPDARRAQWETYRAEKNWLDQKLTDLLVQREAAARHISPAQLVQDELEDPVNQQLDEFLKKNAAKLKPEGRAIVREQMRIRFKSDRAAAFVAQLMQKYNAVEYLSPPAIDEKDLLAIPGPHRGGDPQTAPLRLVIFSDFGCEYCAHTSQSIAAAMQRYGNEISLTFHYLPLEIHYRSQDAAIAAECAAEQNKFWPFHDALMSHGGALRGINFLELASELGLDKNRFRQCLSNDAASGVVNESVRQANLLGIDATPAVFLNGQRIGGDLSEAALMEWIARINRP